MITSFRDTDAIAAAVHRTITHIRNTATPETKWLALMGVAYVAEQLADELENRTSVRFNRDEWLTRCGTSGMFAHGVPELKTGGE